MKKLAIILVLFCISINANAQKCISGDCQNGTGTYVYASGNTYVGSFKNSKRDGKGTYTWTDGDVYIGDWIANEKTGTCTNHYASGEKYVGQILNGNLEGEGVYTLANGYYKKGIFKNNVGVAVKYFDDKNIEISKAIYDEAEKNEAAKSELKLQILNITIPAPNGVYTMTDRAKNVKMQFCTSSQNILCIWGSTPTFYSVNETKVINRLSEEALLQAEIGREVLADFNKNSSTTNWRTSPYFNKKGEGYANEKFQIKINKGKPFGINNDSTYTVTLYNYQKFIDEEIISNFSFWKNENERKTYTKNEKEAYFDVYDDKKYDSRDRKKAKDDYKEKSRIKLTDIHSSYDAIKSVAHVVFTFTHLQYNHSYNVMYDIDFKNKTYKKIGESDYQAMVNNDCYSYIASMVQDKTTKYWFSNFKIINFDDNSIIDIDKAYIEKLNALTNPSDDVEFMEANKDYMIFKGHYKPNKSDSNSTTMSYYFVNKKNNFCEKIINIITQKNSLDDIVFNSDFSKAAFSQKYQLSPNDNILDGVNSVYLLDFKNLSAKLLDDHQYQIDAINNKIIQDKEAKTQSDIRDFERYQITKQNKEIENQNAAAQAERTAKCLCCHGTGQVENKGMYLGQETVRTVSTDGLRTVKDYSVDTYGKSTYSPCGCCRR